MTPGLGIQLVFSDFSDFSDESYTGTKWVELGKDIPVIERQWVWIPFSTNLVLKKNTENGGLSGRVVRAEDTLLTPEDQKYIVGFFEVELCIFFPQHQEHCLLHISSTNCSSCVSE